LEWRAVRAARAGADRLGITHAFSEGKPRAHVNGACTEATPLLHPSRAFSRHSFPVPVAGVAQIAGTAAYWL
jgi:hypothetical protein